MTSLYSRVLGLLVCVAGLCCAQTQGRGSIELVLLDQARVPVAGAKVEVRAGDSVEATQATGESGKVLLEGLPLGMHRVTVSKEGLEKLSREVEVTAQGPVSLELTMVPPMAQKESVTVSATVSSVEEGASAPSQITGETAKQLPGKPPTVADALPLISGVVRDPGGGLVIGASPEHRSALVVNSVDVTDPATGQFGLTVPIDSVEVLNVYQTAYLAEYGRFTAGLVSVETKRGSEKWKWDLNDPLPEFFIRSYHIRGLRTATPRLNFEGPILPGKLYLSEGSEYVVKKNPVYTLPFPHNLQRTQGINSFTQLDWVISPTQLLTGTFHAAPQRLGLVNLDYFHPEETAPDASTRNFTGTLRHHWSLWGGLLDSTVSETRFDASVWGRGTQDLTLAPTGATGNYFAERSQTASRFSGRATYSLEPISAAGSHMIKIGFYAAHSDVDGQLQQRPVDVVSTSGQLLERLEYPRARSFAITDLDYAAFAQDHWTFLPRMALDWGVRTESQQVSGAVRVAPRVGLTWSVASDGRTTFRTGYGLFYEHVPLNVYCFNKYPDQVVTTYGLDGEVIGSPTLYLNTLGQNRVRRPFTFQTPTDGNFSPQSTNWSVEIEHRFSQAVNLRLRYLQNDALGLVTLQPLAPDQSTAQGAVLLSGAGEAKYRQWEATSKIRFASEREFYVSYAYSRARGDLNDFGSYLGTFPSAILRQNQFGTLPASLPHRFLTWGVYRLPRKFQVAPSIEIRSGFPYAATDALQNWVGTPYDKRFPTFLSTDLRVQRDFQVHPKYAVRFAVSGFNLTNHFNPEVVHGNVADPAYGYFFGHRGRRYTADFDFVF